MAVGVISSSPGRAALVPLEPDLGHWRPGFDSAIAAFREGPEVGIMSLEAYLVEASVNTSDETSMRAAFTASLVLDVVRAGGQAIVRNSRLHLAWPDWSTRTPDGIASLRRALLALRGAGPVTYVPPIRRADVMPFLQGMTISLEQADPDNPDAVRAFQAGISTWTMPYRGREGRRRRFVLFGSRGPTRVPLGLLEVGDDAPHNPSRDRLCGFGPNASQEGEAERAPSSFVEWLEERGPAGSRRALADRLAHLRSLLLPLDDFGIDVASPLTTLAADLPRIRELGVGRGDPATLDAKKRLTYLARLVSGELAMRNGTLKDPRTKDGLRVLRDLTVPRIQLEASVCGALPPFGDFLVGKLVAGMFAHPDVRSLAARDLGVITLKTFRPEVADLLPRCGAVLLTTRGLFPGHSAQYNNVRMPGLTGPVSLRRIGDTEGSTTSLFSDRTMRFASALLSLTTGRHRVSRQFGSGGGKRQRTIENAAVRSRISPRVVHPTLRRPVYAASFVGNLRDVALLNANPVWSIDPEATADQYNERSLEEWRRRWIKVAARRTDAS